MVASAAGHAALLVVGLVAFSSPKPLPENHEAIAVEIVDPSALEQVTRGERRASKVLEQPIQRAERQAETVERREAGEAKHDNPAPPTRPPELKLADEATAAPTPPPRPALRPKVEPEAAQPEPPKAAVEKPAPAKTAEAKPETKPEPKPEMRRDQLARLVEEAEISARQKQAEEDAKAAAKAKAEQEAQARTKAEAEARARAVRAEAEAKARAEAAEKAREEAENKAEAAALARAKAEADAKAKAEAEAKAKAAALAKAKADAEAKARREAELAKKFDATDIAKLLQSKEPVQTSGAAAPQINRTASLGTQTGTGQKLNPSMRSQLMGLIKEQLEKCWSVPVALQNAQRPVVPSIRMKLNTDGSLAGQPGVINTSSDPLFRVAADSALVATRRCSPLRIPAQFAAYYDDWRDVIVNFDARDVL